MEYMSVLEATMSNLERDRTAVAARDGGGWKAESETR